MTIASKFLAKEKSMDQTVKIELHGNQFNAVTQLEIIVSGTNDYQKTVCQFRLVKDYRIVHESPPLTIRSLMNIGRLIEKCIDHAVKKGKTHGRGIQTKR